MRAGPLRAGEPVLLIDRKARRYLITLKGGGSSDLRGGRLPHDDLIGTTEGRYVVSTRGERFLLVRPTLADFVLEMPRGAQVIYPKDLSVILLAADIYPGATVLEAGTGSGALTMALLRAVGADGRVYSYEVREEFARTARRNIEQYLGPAPQLVMRTQDIYEGIVDRPLDRIVLDVPEPWRAVPHAAGALREGGIFLSYLPTVPQVMELVRTLRAARVFALIETTETLLRPWNIDGASVRPAHRMVGHTAFITTARRIRPAAEGPVSAEGPEEGDEEQAEAPEQ
ncbi:MAG: tRNA (adenine-N1)-methyltransferase [Armatimonadota bacterium]|nr:tRNA (adenine-N1)-methyltransferase [Armatimonadota bacterium]MDR7450360.1 tRNA (adenine-N1)-methyltransferase [Armatimonadota bacterium]MDR7467057.1 tRNA (adenine-N1)-methyltransferase [Armatimonadota bacterium]MDR7493401.1 tRNA (adenine-N1)-methyltransferase [Armatimonadota bacterium]MDR7499409.1 tRNA (adenine-N1)-methyltransferase [Armatimonadota bacterium]